jgi:hypothetical protein
MTMREKPDSTALDNPAKALLSGMVGALAVTLLHESARRLSPEAPRMDILGMRAIAQGLRLAERRPPLRERLHRWALLGDLVANSLYYSLAASPRPERAWLRGSLLGLAAGVGAVFLPGWLGLGERPSRRSGATQAMTVAWYLMGGLAAAAASGVLWADE